MPSVCDSISGSALRLSVEERRVSSAMFVHSFHVGRTVYKIEYFKECLCKVEEMARMQHDSAKTAVCGLKQKKH